MSCKISEHIVCAAIEPKYLGLMTHGYQVVIEVLTFRYVLQVLCQYFMSKFQYFFQFDHVSHSSSLFELSTIQEPVTHYFYLKWISS